MVEEVLAMFAHSGPSRDPLLDKIGPKQIDRTLDIREKHEENAHQLRMVQHQAAERLTTKCLVFLGFCLLAVLALCWLFLHYGKTDQVFNLIALLFTGAGGAGIGYGIKSKATKNPSSPAEDQFSSDGI